MMLLLSSSSSISAVVATTRRRARASILPSSSSSKLKLNVLSTTTSTSTSSQGQGGWLKVVSKCCAAVEEGSNGEQVNDNYQVLTAINTSYNDILILDSPHSRMLLLDPTHNIHSIFMKGQPWTGSYWDEFASLPPIVPQGPIAIFGLGGGTAAHLMLTLWPSLQLHGWEIDEILIDKAREHLGLSHLEKPSQGAAADGGGVLHVHIGDALSASTTISGGYAGIVIDLFAGGEVLPQLQQVQTWLQLNDKLMPNGRLMINCGGTTSLSGSTDSSTDAAWDQNSTLKTLCEAFPGQPDVVVNCAALSVPRACEADPALAMSVNVPSTLVNWLSTFTQPTNTLLIHLSTDQVYQGTKSFYKEEDQRLPVNVYGTSKVAAEEYIFHKCSNFVILRSSIIFGPQPISPLPKSLPIQWMDGVLAKGHQAEFFHDEFRCPVYVKDVVNIIHILIHTWLSDGKKTQLVLNVGGPNRLSRAEMAETVARVRGYNTTLIKPVSASSIDRGVKSPADISMDISKLIQTLDFTPTSFEDGVKLTFDTSK